MKICVEKISNINQQLQNNKHESLKEVINIQHCHLYPSSQDQGAGKWQGEGKQREGS
uniref:Uncharacterized protein n=1 Tax=Rhizophora mucronata TaxID=61149 RepID=A0A2P2K230_RHIMU